MHHLALLFYFFFICAPTQKTLEEAIRKIQKNSIKMKYETPLFCSEARKKARYEKQELLPQKNGWTCEVWGC